MNKFLSSIVRFLQRLYLTEIGKEIKITEVEKINSLKMNTFLSSKVNNHQVFTLKLEFEEGQEGQEEI